MKQNIVSSNNLFVDRPLNSKAVNSRVPSLWSISTSRADYADATLRFFLVLCLLSSLVLSGLKVNKVAVPAPTSNIGLSLKTISVPDALPKVGFGVSIR